MDHLCKIGQHTTALELARDFVQDQSKASLASAAGSGLRGPRERRRRELAAKLLSVLDRHLEASVTTAHPTEGGVAELAAHFGRAVPPAVDACVAIKKKDVLFGKVRKTPRGKNPSFGSIP